MALATVNIDKIIKVTSASSYVYESFVRQQNACTAVAFFRTYFNLAASSVIPGLEIH